MSFKKGFRKGWDMMSDRVLTLDERNELHSGSFKYRIGMVFGVVLSIITGRVIIELIKALIKWVS